MSYTFTILAVLIQNIEITIKMNRVVSYNVFDLGRCNLNEKDNSLLSLPNLQRGAVWKPLQIELLWDSLLRNFPIGTLIVLSDSLDCDKPKGEILDGQQRIRAIISGFNKVNKDSDSIVWVDLNPANLQDREYAIRVTNRAHPWGYDLIGRVFEANRRNNAIRRAGEEPGSDKSKWNILNFGPEGESVIPVPLLFFLDADCNDSIRYIINRCEQLGEIAPVWKKKYLDKVKSLPDNQFNKYLDAIKTLRLNEYKIPSIVIDSKCDLDLLFSRIGIQGTQITDKELAYALMKSYWDQDGFGPTNELRSQGIASEEDFAQIIFRLFSSTKTLRGNIDHDFVRKLRYNPNSEDELSAIRESILKAYDNNGIQIAEMTEKVAKWLLTCYDSNEAYHQLVISDIARRKPSLYILLLRLCIIQEEGRLELSPRYIQALAFYLHICLWDDRTINYIYAFVCEKEGPITERIVSERLSDFITFSCEWAMPVVNSFIDFPALREDALDIRWTYERYSGQRGFSLFKRLFAYGNSESAFVLQLAERRYFHKRYEEYNPCRKDLWEDLNRPWDHDHIVPQDWIGEKDWSPFLKQWINSIGNIADIPFELNRAKQNQDDWSYYYSFADDLLFHPKGGKLELSENLSEDDNAIQRKEFFDFVRDRFLHIVEPFLKILARLKLTESLSDNQAQRKQFLMKVWKKHSECKLFFLQNGIEYEFNPNDNFGWQQTRLTLSYDYGDKERVVALTMSIEDDGKYSAECGLRKRPELDIEQLDNHDWWDHKDFSSRYVYSDKGMTSHRGGWNPEYVFDALMEKYKSL